MQILVWYYEKWVRRCAPFPPRRSVNNLSIFRPCSLPGKMGPYPIVTSKPHWKSCQIKWQTSKTIIWLHRAGEQSGTGTLLSQLLFCSLPFVHFCASKIQTADELLLLAVKSCIKNQSEKLTITWNHSMQGSLGVIQTGSFKSGFRLRCRWFLLFTSGENSGKIFPLSFPFKKLF